MMRKLLILFVDAHMREFAQVAVGKPVGDRSGDRGSYRPPVQPNSFATFRHGNVRAHSASVSSPKLTVSVERGSLVRKAGRRTMPGHRFSSSSMSRSDRAASLISQRRFVDSGWRLFGRLP